MKNLNCVEQAFAFSLFFVKRGLYLKLKNIHYLLIKKPISLDMDVQGFTENLKTLNTKTSQYTALVIRKLVTAKPVN